MSELPLTQVSRWKFALKPASWPKLLVPMLLGQAIGIAASGAVSLGAIAYGVAFTVLDGVFIVLLNDWADRDIDALKRRLLPRAGSRKTIADGVLPAVSVLAGGLAAGAAALGLSVAAAVWLDRPLLGLSGIACLGVFAAYSLPPLRLNYRGGGELLEAFGVGMALPWLNAYAQSGRVTGAELWVLSGYTIASLASAVASGLGDEVSDRAGGKHTVVTAFGNARARHLTERLMLAGAVVWLLSAWPAPDPTIKLALVCAAVILAWGWRRLRGVSALATTHAFREQGAYKLELHRMIWGSGIVLAACELLQSLVRAG